MKVANTPVLCKLYEDAAWRGHALRLSWNHSWSHGHCLKPRRKCGERTYNGDLGQSPKHGPGSQSLIRRSLQDQELCAFLHLQNLSRSICPIFLQKQKNRRTFGGMASLTLKSANGWNAVVADTAGRKRYVISSRLCYSVSRINQPLLAAVWSHVESFYTDKHTLCISTEVHPVPCSASHCG